MTAANDTSPAPLKGISSMATRLVLADLVDAFAQRSGDRADIESVGGVDAAKRVQAGEAFDVVILASDAIDKLIAGGHLQAGSRVDLVRSGVAAAVRAGAPVPDISSEDALRQAVLAARTLSYSTGPSGVALQKLFERWGIAEQIAPRIVQAPPGVPVGALVATQLAERRSPSSTAISPKARPLRRVAMVRRWPLWLVFCTATWPLWRMHMKVPASPSRKITSPSAMLLILK